MTAHTCACCPLRFATNGELADHVRNEHSERPTFHRDRLSVVRQHHVQRPARPGGTRD